MKRYALLVALLAMLWATEAMAVTIGFDNLGGLNQSPFTSSYVEDGYRVTPTGGHWFVAQQFGNAVPAIFAGPIGNPGVSQISLTDVTGGQFTFTGLDLTSNSASGTSYLIRGFVGGPLGTQVFSNSVVIGSINHFDTRLFASLGPVDVVTITGSPAQGVTSFNIDNIQVVDTVTHVPEPAPILLLGAGLAGIGIWRRQSANI